MTDLTRRLLDWSDAVRRDLPWRRTRDPWAVLVSETMLQQTQVARAIGPFTAWMARWPTPADLAAEAPGAAITAWSGLGYNSRALRLHRAATAITDRHGGRVPSTLEELLSLPGVGPYTARAVLAFAFERSVGVVDTNAARVLARAFAGRRLTGREVQRLADGLVPTGRGWVWNSAMLDLGATVCTARGPGCPTCPLATGCAWRCQPAPGPDPAVGSAGVSGRQAPFEGSDRQGRGRLVAALRVGPVARVDLPTVCGWPSDPARAVVVADGLIADGLAVDDLESGLLALP